MKIHEKYITRCIDIAKNGLGNTRPNPMVGCVIVHENNIIGEGFTSPYGGNHAEVNAIHSVQDPNLLKKATLYVTLEPCSHFGKTPPCSDLIIKSQIPNVVIGTIDTHSKVAGKGIEKLTAAGCNVTVGILENECQEHHKRFFTFHNKLRPYIILKWAQTLDGYLAPETQNKQEPVWITNTFSRQIVHKWRTEEHAIFVGTNTVIKDNPKLTVRDWKGQNPIRIVLDRTGKLPKNLGVFNNESKTIVISSSENTNVLNSEFTQTEFIAWEDNTHIAKQICELLHKQDIQSVIIEGGAQTLHTFINEGLWDEARVFTGNVLFEKGIEAPKIHGTLVSQQHILQDSLKIYRND
ncbi:bifunctional diaminohydroxyphosphoribosylaminopyrimidine deaminase/5-amino-6-(5-phosphoribosylamino)uracil reductase RibD [Mangrovimonas sp. DI 80]|uniref:bifunctional diaminohydroxyphosphoribosylaminopyrimidine deaminase/5-amino-6-(5-phosphoribosylamino)uracil reductase RibD n=1 Tax=Mangrovimonas sp. DI 80 TaxID=1779330 RepID=UPI00097896D0|nr:bifunctional diaminohydroxyphosphoribosylaminopyrimidine deaminase/5-amino-6-(5-phosphoribosylamino)uracil reductase RibD [Mangrovimonas sp. DI 80]OMP29797.1 riboflavin biosynthesis protein RibD [Mangrovimonas sp. DI 80]